VLPCAGTGTASAAPEREVAVTVQQSGRSGRTPRYTDHQIPAGLAITVELRTSLSSNSSQKDQEVRGRLVRPIVSGEAELVPAGASVLGTVTEVEPAGNKARGWISVSFHVVEHPETGSRATIRSAIATWESEPPAKGKVYPEVRVERGEEVTVTLRAPLVVRIPVK
jgi:hypothetical protein